MEQQLAIKWLLDNQVLINNSIKFKDDQLNEFFKVYNAITGEKKGRTSCGRCLLSMKRRLQTETNKINLMQKFEVYRTWGGNLSLKPNKAGSIFTIHASTEAGAKEALISLKQIENREQRKIDE